MTTTTTPHHRPLIAMNSIARKNRYAWTLGLLALIFGALAGCALTDRPHRPTMYDFGPGGLSGGAHAAGPGEAKLAPLALADIDAAGPIDSTAVLYRLGYADDHQLRPYAEARWAMSPPQLLRQRLRDRLGAQRVVLNADELSSLGRGDGPAPLTLRIELEEFSQWFESPSQSVGLLRLRATLIDSTPAGDRLLAQRSVVMRRPAPTPDAPGGVRALADASDAAVQDIAQWLQQVR